MVFVPDRYPIGNWRPVGLVFEDVWFAAQDGTRLNGWYVPHPQSRAVVLFCHGNGGNVALWASVLQTLHDRMGVTAMGFDYRGYGRSEGTPSEAGVLADARACENGWHGGPVSRKTRSCSWAARWAARWRSI